MEAATQQMFDVFQRSLDHELQRYDAQLASIPVAKTGTNAKGQQVSYYSKEDMKLIDMAKANHAAWMTSFQSQRGVGLQAAAEEARAIALVLVGCTPSEKHVIERARVQMTNTWMAHCSKQYAQTQANIAKIVGTKKHHTAQECAQVNTLRAQWGTFEKKLLASMHINVVEAMAKAKAAARLQAAPDAQQEALQTHATASNAGNGSGNANQPVVQSGGASVLKGKAAPTQASVDNAMEEARAKVQDRIQAVYDQEKQQFEAARAQIIGLKKNFTEAEKAKLAAIDEQQERTKKKYAKMVAEATGKAMEEAKWKMLHPGKPLDTETLTMLLAIRTCRVWVPQAATAYTKLEAKKVRTREEEEMLIMLETNITEGLTKIARIEKQLKEKEAAEDAKEAAAQVATSSANTKASGGASNPAAAKASLLYLGLDQSPVCCVWC